MRISIEAHSPIGERDSQAGLFVARTAIHSQPLNVPTWPGMIRNMVHRIWKTLVWLFWAAWYFALPDDDETQERRLQWPPR